MRSETSVVYQTLHFDFPFVTELIELQLASSCLSRLLWHSQLRRVVLPGMEMAPYFSGFILSNRKLLVDSPLPSPRSVPRPSLCRTRPPNVGIFGPSINREDRPHPHLLRRRYWFCPDLHVCCRHLLITVPF